MSDRKATDEPTTKPINQFELGITWKHIVGLILGLILLFTFAKAIIGF